MNFVSAINSHTFCSGLDWNIMLGVLAQLKRANRIREYLLIGTGCYLGLRANDLLNLRWIDLLNNDEVIIMEQKTGKIRQLSINCHLNEILNHASSLSIKHGQI